VTPRAAAYALLDLRSHEHGAARMRALLVAVNLLGIASVSVGTIDAVGPAARAIAATVTGIVATVFLVEYAIRLWVAPEIPHMGDESKARARLRWALSLEGLIDLVAIIPALATASGGARLGAESASVFVLLWVLKLATHAPGVTLILRVFRNERSPLVAALALFTIVLLSSATAIHLLEGERQPEPFGSIPSALWWSMTTLTTTGYGDVIPQTNAGRMIGGVVMLCGISVLALLAGILATGFAEEVKRREFTRIWDLVARVPLFAELGAIAIADIVARLRSRTYPAGAYVVRKGERGDAMYFIVSGRAEVRLGRPLATLAEGDFFGEMALLDRKPRSADVVTLVPSTLLVLEVADFYQLAAQQPALIASIEAEAKRRRARGGPAAPAGALSETPPA
jgi:voltage-gated potassium channel